MADELARIASIFGAGIANINYTTAMSVQPARGSLTNLENQRRLDFQFNPVQLRESYRAQYARHGSMGLSHERMQFTGNKNWVSSIDLIFDELVDRERKQENPSLDRRPNGNARLSPPNYPTRVRRQFLEMMYPRRSQRLSQAAPPQVLFIWPGWISMRVRITAVDLAALHFQNVDPVPRIITVKVTLEEDVDRRMYSEEQFQFGTQRPWATRTSTNNRSRRR